VADLRALGVVQPDQAVVVLDSAFDLLNQHVFGAAALSPP
jgi:hypothetical protein